MAGLARRKSPGPCKRTVWRRHRQLVPPRSDSCEEHHHPRVGKPTLFESGQVKPLHLVHFPLPMPGELAIFPLPAAREEHGTADQMVASVAVRETEEPVRATRKLELVVRFTGRRARLDPQSVELGRIDQVAGDRVPERDEPGWGDRARRANLGRRSSAHQWPGSPAAQAHSASPSAATAPGESNCSPCCPGSLPSGPDGRMRVLQPGSHGPGPRARTSRITCADPQRAAGKPRRAWCGRQSRLPRPYMNLKNPASSRDVRRL